MTKADYRKMVGFSLSKSSSQRKNDFIFCLRKFNILNKFSTIKLNALIVLFLLTSSKAAYRTPVRLQQLFPRL